MAMNGIVKIVLTLLSLAFPNCAFPDFYNYGPINRPQARPHMTDTRNRNQYPGFPNQTFIHTERSTKQGEHNDDSQIIYPDTHVTPNCIYGLCENVADYPTDQIKQLLSRSQFMHGYFEVSEEFVSVDNRFNTDEMSLCDTKVHTIYPEKANNTMKIEKVIVNVEGHKQGIVFETCVNNGKCKFSSNFPTGYTSYCKQKYIHKKLMVLGDNDKFVYDSFEVPSCCVCTVSRTN